MTVSPPLINWLTCGNTSNQKLKENISTTQTEAIKLLSTGERIVEIQGDQ